MKITFVLPTVNLSGGIRVASIYVRRLAELGHDVVAISPPRPRRSVLERLRRPFATDVLPHLSKSHFDDKAFNHRVLDRWRPVTDADVPDADVVVATWWETAEWVAGLSPRKGTKVHFVQGYEVFDWLPVERCKATYRLPMHKIVVAQWLKTVMERDYGSTRVDVVPNSVDHRQFFAPERGKQSRPTVGFLYAKGPLKAVGVTLHAIAALRREIPGLRVVAFGSNDPERGELPDVEFHRSPAQSALRDIYASCDVWLTASRSEGFNLPAMESMACRTPVVSTRTGWPEEAIIDGANGWCVDVDDVIGLARGARHVLTLSDADWRAMSQRAFDTVRDSSWEASAAAFERALVGARERDRQRVGASAATAFR